MKTERILEIADLIEAGRDDMTFDMTTFGTADTECGTAACIAGWAVARYGACGQQHDFDHERPLRAGVDEYARRGLCLTEEEARSLFLPNPRRDGLGLAEVTADHAVRTLRHLAATGEVDWRATANA